MAKVSICIPVYNTKEYLHKCLESVLRQTHDDIEVLCLDDGSNDNSREILKYFENNDKRISIYHSKHIGQAKARNILLSQSTGKYIYFVDSDDYLVPDAIEKMHREAEIKNLDVVHCKIYPFYDNKVTSKEINKKIEYYNINYNNDNILTGIQLIENMRRKGKYINSTASNFILKNFLIKNKINFSLLDKYEDKCFCTKIYYNAKKILILDDICYMRRYRENSLMTHYDNVSDIYLLYKCYKIICKYIIDKKLLNKHNNKTVLYPLNNIKKYIMSIYKKITNDEVYKLLYTSDQEDYENFLCYILTLQSDQYNHTIKKNNMIKILTKILGEKKYDIF